MKKPIILLTLLLGLTTAAQAQRRGRSGSDVSLGLKAGGSLTTITGPDATNVFTNRFGFHAGIFANIGFTPLFAFQPELIYSQKGAKLNVVGGSERLHYVDIPLAFHVNTDGLFFELGPQVGFLVAAKQEVGNVSTDVKGRYNTVDFGYLAGLGYQLKQGLGVGLRYNGGFTNIEQPSIQTPTVTVQNRRRNSAFQLYLTYSVNGRR